MDYELHISHGHGPGILQSARAAPSFGMDLQTGKTLLKETQEALEQHFVTMSSYLTGFCSSEGEVLCVFQPCSIEVPSRPLELLLRPLIDIQRREVGYKPRFSKRVR